MKINPDVLKQAAERATQDASQALSTLVGHEVTATTTLASYLPLNKLVILATNEKKHQIVAFSQLISGIKGAALLVMDYADALLLVDSLLKRPAGTTTNLAKIEESAIKEMLNILSNSQLTALAKQLHITVNVLPPHMISPERIGHALDYLTSHEGENADIVVFETSLVVTGQASQVAMFIVFDGKLVTIIEGEEETG